MPTWSEFAWAAFLYGAIGGDRDYQCLMSQTQFLNSLRATPMGLQTDEIQEKLIRGFLNPWKCRVNNNPQSAGAIQVTLRNLLPYLGALSGLEIATADFNKIVSVNNNRRTVHEVIEDCYTMVKSIGFRFAATATSKLLHILQPELFVMWDKDILAHYKQNNQQVSDSGQGYCVYLRIMQHVATQVDQSFQNAGINVPAGANQNPAAYLSRQMNYNPPQTLAKYLDEYNWVTITNGVQVPPAWHP